MTPLEIALSMQKKSSQPPPPTAPAGFVPGVTYVGGRPDVITTPLAESLPDGSDYTSITDSMGITLPIGARLELVAASYDPAAWSRSQEITVIEGVERKTPATTAAVWRYRFRVVYDAASIEDTDLAELVKEAKAKGPASPREAPRRPSPETTKVVILGDLQIGKTNMLGGTVELLQRLAIAKERVIADTREQKPAELILGDMGDIIEGFESAPEADRTNDMGQVQQLRLARRILFDWVDSLAPLVPKLTVVGVPSNHCRVRRGKQTMGSPGDDYGIENIFAVADICMAAGDRFDHVSFVTPPDQEEAVAYETLGGKILGFAHGHQAGQPDKLGDYVAGQALGRMAIGNADIFNFGHYHQYLIRTVGDDRWIFIHPTMDNGSGWFTNNKGHRSRTGVSTYMVDSAGWYDNRVIWT